MKIVYYPGDQSQSPNSLCRFIRHELRKKNKSQWRQMDMFLRETGLGSQQDLVDIILSEQKKAWDKRMIASLGDGLYEYRGKQAKSGTIRVYFSFNEEVLCVLDAEYKTSDKNVIERARERLKAMFPFAKEQ